MAVPVGVAVGVGVRVGDAVAVGVPVAVGVGVAVELDVEVGDAVGVSAGVGLGVPCSVTVGVGAEGGDGWLSGGPEPFGDTTSIPVAPGVLLFGPLTTPCGAFPRTSAMTSTSIDSVSLSTA